MENRLKAALVAVFFLGAVFVTNATTYITPNQVNTTGNITGSYFCNTTDCSSLAELLLDTDTDTTIGNCSTTDSCNSIYYLSNQLGIHNISALISSFNCSSTEKLGNITITDSGITGICYPDVNTDTDTRLSNSSFQCTGDQQLVNVSIDGELITGVCSAKNGTIIDTNCNATGACSVIHYDNEGFTTIITNITNLISSFNCSAGEFLGNVTVTSFGITGVCYISPSTDTHVGNSSYQCSGDEQLVNISIINGAITGACSAVNYTFTDTDTNTHLGNLSFQCNGNEQLVNISLINESLYGVCSAKNESIASISDTNCNATGSCSAGSVAYMGYNNSGDFNITGKLFVGDWSDVLLTASQVTGLVNNISLIDNLNIRIDANNNTQSAQLTALSNYLSGNESSLNALIAQVQANNQTQSDQIDTLTTNLGNNESSLNALIAKEQANNETQKGLIDSKFNTSGGIITSNVNIQGNLNMTGENITTVNQLCFTNGVCFKVDGPNVLGG